MNKLGTAFGCLLLLGVALVPGAFAHYDAGVDGAFGDADDDSNANRVSGWYVGSASALLGVENLADASAQCAPLDDNGGPLTPAYDLCVALLSGGTFQTGAAFALCDLEVSFPGGLENDEAFVDGSNLGPGTVEDHWNDGGIGAVCHTPEGNYDSIENGFDYDTGGCGYAAATGQDAVSPYLWVSTSCDDTTPGSTGGLVNHVLALDLCAVNSVLAANIPGDIAGFVAAEAECVDNFVECANEVLKTAELQPTGGSLETATDNALNGLSGGPADNAANTGPAGSDCPQGASSCGGDSSGDDGEFGDAQAPGGVAFPSTTACDAFGSASVFVWNAVVIDAGSPDVKPGVPTVGWIN